MSIKTNEISQEQKNLILLKHERDKLKAYRELKQEISMANNKLDDDVYSDLITPDDPAKIQADAAAYQRAISSKMEFVNPKLSKLVTFTQNQLYLICAQTGKGKSTAVANIVAPLVQQGKKILIVANEERQSDVYYRVACLLNGLSFYKYKQGTLAPSEALLLTSEANKLTASIKVVDTTFKGDPRHVTTVNGIKKILNAAKDSFDALLIDYYQKIAEDSEVPGKDINSVQNELALFLDNYKNTFNGPIVMMAQLWPIKKDQKAELQDRLQGRKSIINVCTYALEIISDKTNYKTIWKCHKDRFHGHDGEGIVFGYDRELCSYISDPDTDFDFIKKVAGWMANRLLNGIVTEDSDKKDDK